MNFQLNNNGNSADDLREQFMKLNDAIMTAEGYLRSMDYTHGRNYQTMGNAAELQAEDQREFREIVGHVEVIKAFAMAGAARVIRQREGL